VSTKPITVGEKIQTNIAIGTDHNSTLTTCSPGFSHGTDKREEKILLVDDESDIATLFALVLKNRGFDVDMFNDPLQALSNFQPNLYDLVLLDFALPNMNGLELFKKIRMMDNKVKICFLSAYDYEVLKEQFPLLNTECFIPKPINIKDFIQRITLQLIR
jgi:DNA-binding response OmpR family regulator